MTLTPADLLFWLVTAGASCLAIGALVEHFWELRRNHHRKGHH